MAEAPPNCAERPDRVSDALSAMLRAVRLHGVRTAHCTSSGRFIDHIAPQRAIYVAITPGFAVATGAQRVQLAPGDLVLVARGDGRTLFGDGPTEWLHGEFEVDADVADPILSVLPPIIHCAATDPASQWLPLSMHLLLEETVHPGPGSEVMASRILDLLFIHALRQWSATSPRATPGWLTAAMDPHIGAALSEMHGDPHREWTVAELARTALLSRSAFAKRFMLLMGTSPALYLTEQRMAHAKELLRETNLAINEVGRAVGYLSESSFSRAFTRCCGTSPRAWRRAKADAPHHGPGHQTSTAPD